MPDQSFSGFTKDSKVVNRLFWSGDKCWDHEDGRRVPQVLHVKKLDRPRCGQIESKTTFPGCFYLKMNFAHAVFPEFLHMLKVASTIASSFIFTALQLSVNIHRISQRKSGV